MSKEVLQIISLSFYRDKTSAEPRATNIGQVQDAICGSFYEQQVKIIRQLKEQGREEAADEVKNNLHDGTFSTTFNNLLRSSIYQQYNNLMVIDITSNTYYTIATAALFIMELSIILCN